MISSHASGSNAKHEDIVNMELVLFVICTSTCSWHAGFGADIASAALQGQQAHMAGNIMAFFLVSGCSLGAAAGFLWLL